MEKKTALPSIRNIEWRTVNTKTEKNKSRTNIYISTNNINELNNLIYVGAKSICEKKSKTGRKIRLETQMKYLRKQAKMIKQRKNSGTYRDTKEKATQEKCQYK